MTKNQQEVLSVIAKRNPDGSLVDIDQLIEGVDYEVTKQAIQHTIRSLVNQGLIIKEGKEVRRKRQRVTFSPTVEGAEEYATLIAA